MFLPVTAILLRGSSHSPAAPGYPVCFQASHLQAQAPSSEVPPRGLGHPMEGLSEVLSTRNSLQPALGSLQEPSLPWLPQA